MKIHHIGYLVKDMKKGIENFKVLGYQVIQENRYDEERDIHICFLENDGYVIELVSPCSERSVVYELLKKQGSAPYHICYSVPNIEVAVASLRKQKFVQTQKIAPALALNDKNVVFLYHNKIGMIELVEDEDE